MPPLYLGTKLDESPIIERRFIELGSEEERRIFLAFPHQP
jgi:hypothetical protein